MLAASNKIKMSTPAMAFGVGLRNVVVSLWLIWVVTFCISRVFLFHEAYIFESNKRADERWLLSKCKDAEFYSNIRQHTDLCTEVANSARTNLLLTALNRVASQTHACGGTSCVELVYVTLSRMGWQLGLLLVVLMVVAPNFVYMMLMQMHRKRVLQSSENALMRVVQFDDSCIESATCEANNTGALRLRRMHSKRVDEDDLAKNNTVKLV